MAVTTTSTPFTQRNLTMKTLFRESNSTCRGLSIDPELSPFLFMTICFCPSKILNLERNLGAILPRWQWMRVSVCPVEESLSGLFLTAHCRVGAYNADGSLAAFSNWGKESVTLLAPGERIYSTHLNGGYKFLSGTSMATPHVSGQLPRQRYTSCFKY